MKQISLSLNAVSQMSHVGWGIVTVWAMMFLFHQVWWIGGLTLLGIASLKEGLVDVFFEDTETRGNGWEDWAYWMLGGVIGIVSAYVRGIA